MTIEEKELPEGYNYFIDEMPKHGKDCVLVSICQGSYGVMVKGYCDRKEIEKTKQKLLIDFYNMENR